MTKPVPDLPAEVRPHPQLPQWLVDSIFALLIVLVAVFPPPVEDFAPTTPVTWALILLPVVVLPWRRSRPLLVLSLCFLLFGAAASLGILSPGVGIAIAGAMFQVVTSNTRKVGFLVGCLAVIAIMVLTLPITMGNLFDPRTWQFGLVVAFAGAAGDGARSHRAYIAAVTERAERAEQTRESEAKRRVTEERLRIARDLHDAVAHQIAVISLNAGVASQVFDSQPEKAKASLSTIRAAGRTVLQEIGDLMHLLRAEDDEAIANASPQRDLEHLGPLLEQFREAGMHVRLEVNGDLSHATGAVGFVAYRVLQEALTNAHKHGAGDGVQVRISMDPSQMTITVTNSIDPLGESENNIPRVSSGVGLLGLRERVSSARGTLETTQTSSEWRLIASLPIARKEPS